MVQVGALAQNIDTLIGAAIVTPGVTSPLTNAQIARAYPQDALTGAAVDKPVLLKSKGDMSVRVVKLAEVCLIPTGWFFCPEGTPCLSQSAQVAYASLRAAFSIRPLLQACQRLTTLG
tara:strand:- start:927 stop:1280 length:354 start_codon:yes stop_codon:yes gene_type:complete